MTTGKRDISALYLTLALLGAIAAPTLCADVTAPLQVSPILQASETAQTLPTPPTQPESGPGGTDYVHGAVMEHSYDVGDKQYWIFEPNEPHPKSAPVVIFNHGWGGMKPDSYRAWINHIVRRGNIVIYPRYQATAKSPTTEITPNSLAATKAALRRLETEAGHTRPMLDKVAAVGHSAGGQITANLAASAAKENLPQPKAIMCVQPGKSWGPVTRIAIPLFDLKGIPANTLLLTVVGDQDNIARDIDAKRIFLESVNVPSANKNYVELISDDHGSPPLKANHFAPTAFLPGNAPSQRQPQTQQPARGSVLRGAMSKRLQERLAQRTQANRSTQADQPEQPGRASLTGGLKRLDALDFYGTWKLFDALCDAAFYQRNREYALGATPQQQFMGYWSDGVPVKPMIVIDHM